MTTHQFHSPIQRTASVDKLTLPLLNFASHNQAKAYWRGEIAREMSGVLMREAKKQAERDRKDQPAQEEQVNEAVRTVESNADQTLAQLGLSSSKREELSRRVKEATQHVRSELRTQKNVAGALNLPGRKVAGAETSHVTAQNAVQPVLDEALRDRDQTLRQQARATRNEKLTRQEQGWLEMFSSALRDANLNSPRERAAVTEHLQNERKKASPALGNEIDLLLRKLQTNRRS